MRPEIQPLFSIIIPARDEEHYLPHCLKSISVAAQNLGAPPEIIVILNRCTDRTEEIALAAGARIVREDSKNLAQIRNAGARVATGEYLITIDADSRMSPNMLTTISTLMTSDKFVGGGVWMWPERWSLGVFFSGVLLIPVIVRHRILGGLFFTRLEYFRAVGGFNEELLSAEDIDFAKRLKKFGQSRGLSFKMLFKAYIVTSCRKLDRLGDWYFVTRPRLLLDLLRGKNEANANKYWYDFERK